MKKIVFFLLCFIALFSQKLQAQNLIPNGDFEQGYPVTTTEFKYTVDSNCAINTGSIVTGCDYWVADFGTAPIRFVHNSPHFVWCYDNLIPHSGSGYVGFNGNDAAYTTLINPLLIGHKYKLEYYSCLDSTWFAYWIAQGGDSATNIVFSFNSSGNVLNSPIITYSGFGVWKKYDTVFIAQSSSTEFHFHGNNQSPLGIYIDDISLQEDSTSAVIENSISISPPDIIYDPARNILSIKFNNDLFKTILISNLLGQCINNSVTKEEQADISTNTINSGIYYVTIFSNNLKYSKTIFLTKNN